jgi:hypothetical protein
VGYFRERTICERWKVEMLEHQVKYLAISECVGIVYGRANTSQGVRVVLLECDNKVELMSFILHPPRPFHIY